MGTMTQPTQLIHLNIPLDNEINLVLALMNTSMIKQNKTIQRTVLMHKLKTFSLCIIT